MDHAAFPFGEGGRAQRGRMRSSPWRTANPAGWGRSFGAVRTCRFQRGRTSSPARKLRLLPLGLREPAVSNAGGLRRLLGNSGVFPWGCANLPFPTRADCVACSETPAASLGVARTCRFQRGRTSSPARKLWCLPLVLCEPVVSNAGGLRRLLGNSGVFPWGCANLSFPLQTAAQLLGNSLFAFPFLLSLCVAPGLPPRPAQGLTPPLHLRKGFHPLTRFRWRDPWRWSNLRPLTLFRWRVPMRKGGSAAFAAEPPQSFIQ